MDVSVLDLGSQMIDPDFRYELAAQPGGENINKCFACGSCTISCPVFEIDEEYNPRKIIRMVLLGLKQELLSSGLIWSCVNCYTCYERCPQDVRFTTIIHALRNMAIKEAKAKRIKLASPAYFLANSFTKSVKRHGRSWEPGLMGGLWLRLMDISRVFAFIPLGAKMFFKGKLSLLPSSIKGKKEIKRIFMACEDEIKQGGNRR